MTALALVRHGRTAWNDARRIQGSTDVPLDAVGRSQAVDAAAELAELGSWSAVVASPMLRARQTATIIAERLSLPLLEPVEALAERDCGLAEGMTVEEANERWPALDYPGAEPIAALGLRTARALELVAARTPGAVVVSHGQALRRGLESLTGAPVPRIANAEVILLEHSGRGVWRRALRAPV